MTILMGASAALQSVAQRAGTWLSSELSVVRLNEEDSHFLATDKGMTMVRPANDQRPKNLP